MLKPAEPVEARLEQSVPHTTFKGSLKEECTVVPIKTRALLLAGCTKMPSSISVFVLCKAEQRKHPRRAHETAPLTPGTLHPIPGTRKVAFPLFNTTHLLDSTFPNKDNNFLIKRTY